MTPPRRYSQVDPDMVHAENIARSFGSRQVLRDIGFRLGTGEFALLAGPNGAGKTTLLRILAGYAPPSVGLLRVAGYELPEDALDAQAHLGYVPERQPLYDDMRVFEYLRFRGLLRRLPRRVIRRRVADLAERFELGAIRRGMIGALAKGQRARVAIADALLHEPAVLLLDEPLAALDSEGRAQLIDALREVVDKTAVIMATHAPEAGAACFTRALILRDGALEADIPLDPATNTAENIRALLRQPAGDGDTGRGGD